MAADYYQDFVFAALNGSVDDSQTNWVVDDVSAFPAQYLLDKTDFWITAESDLSHPPTFEIVKLTGVDIGTLTLTVVRGQQGTVGAAHDDATLVKGSLGAGALHRARANLAVYEQLPDYDGEVFQRGDRVWVTSDQISYVFSGISMQFYLGNYGDVDNGTLGQVLQETTAGNHVSASQWLDVIGHWGTVDPADPRYFGGAHHAAYISGAVGDESITLAHLGAKELAVSGSLTTPNTSTSEAGVCFNFTSDGQNGYYLSFLPGSPPQLYRVVAGVYTSMGFIGTDDVLTNSVADYYAIQSYEGSVRIWYQNQANTASGLWVLGEFTETVDFPLADCFGFAVRNADACADTNLTFGGISSWTPIGPGTGVVLGNQGNFYSPTGDNLTTMTLPELFQWNWVNAIGVFGSVGSQGKYVSGAVGDRALAVIDMGIDNYKMEVDFIPGAVGTSDWGFWLKGDDTLDNGYYLSVSQGDFVYGVTPDPPAATVNLHRIQGGVDTDLGQVLSFSNDGNSHFFYIVISQQMINFWMDTNTGFPTSFYVFANEDFNFKGGQNFGWVLNNADALADTMALTGLFFLSPSFDNGWMAEPTFRTDAGAPIVNQPVGSTYIDQGDFDRVYISAGGWLSLQPATIVGSGVPTMYAQSGALYYDGNDKGLWVNEGGGTTWFRVGGILTGTGSPNDALLTADSSGALYMDIQSSSTGLWVWNETASIWINCGGSGGGGGGLPIDGYFPISGTVHVGDLVLQNGALWQSVKDGGGGQIEPSYADSFQFNPPETGGTNHYWALAGDATLDASTGDVSLTVSAPSSGGVAIHTPNSLSPQGFHITFESETSGGGFALSFIQDTNNPVISDSTPPGYHHYAYPVSTTPGGFGVDQSGAGFPDGPLTIFFPDNGTDNMSLTGDGYTSVATPFYPTTGVHEWDIRIELDIVESPGNYDMTIYCDGVRVSSYYFSITDSAVLSGFVAFSALNPATGSPGVSHIRNVQVVSAYEWQRVHTNLAGDPWHPLVLTAPWTAGSKVPEFYFSGERIYFRGELTGGSSTDTLFDIAPDMAPDNLYSYTWVVGVQQELSGTKATCIIEVASAAASIVVPDLVTGATVNLDNVSWRRKA